MVWLIRPVCLLFLMPFIAPSKKKTTHGSAVGAHSFGLFPSHNFFFFFSFCSFFPSLAFFFVLSFWVWSWCLSVPFCAICILTLLLLSMTRMFWQHINFIFFKCGIILGWRSSSIDRWRQLASLHGTFEEIGRLIDSIENETRTKRNWNTHYRIKQKWIDCIMRKKFMRYRRGVLSPHCFG